MASTEKIDKLFEYYMWYGKLKESTNEHFMPLYLDEHRYLVLRGGAASGKSIFAGRKVLERVVNEPGHRWLVCRKVAKSLRDSCYDQLLDQIREFYPDSCDIINDAIISPMQIRFKNGSVILFAGLDDVDKIKSIYKITGAWIEEASEILESDFNEIDRRIRHKTENYKQIILSFNPVSIMHWLKRRFFDNLDEIVDVHRLDENNNVVLTDSKPKRDFVCLHHSTAENNRFLEDDEKIRLASKKAENEYEYNVYYLGEWGVTGDSVFSSQEITEKLMSKPQPLRQGYYDYMLEGTAISNIMWVDEKNGGIKIYEEPQEGYPYVIGGDTAGDGSDNFTLQCINNVTGYQAAVFKRRISEDEYARQAFCMGISYNEALIGLEVNFSTYPISKLEEYGYKHLYIRGTKEDDYTHKIKTLIGFRTDTRTRKSAIEGMVEFARDNLDMIDDEDTLGEMLTFVRNESFRPEAEQGAHDDLIMAFVIALYIRPQGRQYVYSKEASRGLIDWTQDKLDDYYNASPEERKYLESKWGQPIYG